MRKMTTLLFTLSLAAMTACSKAPADSIASTAESTASSAAAESVSEDTPAPAEEPAGSAAEEAPADLSSDAADEQRNVLNGFVDFAADTAGGSLKSARAAANLVEYLSYADIDSATSIDWMESLSQDQRDLLNINWSEILSNAQNIVSDPAGQADLLESAGVTTDFEGLVLTEVPDKLVSLNTVFSGKAG